MKHLMIGGLAMMGAAVLSAAVMSTAAQAKERRCPPGHVVVGLKADGQLICEDIHKVKRAGGSSWVTRIRSEKDGAGAQAGEAESKTPPTAITGLKQVGDDRFVMTRALMQSWLADPSALARGGRVIPHYVDGKPQGFKFLGIRKSSAWRALGLKNGDVLKAVNGQSLHSPAEAMALYVQLKALPLGSEIKVELVRRGQSIIQRYSVVERLPK